MLTTLLSEHAEINRLVVHADRLGRVDITGALALKRIGRNLATAGVEMQVRNTTHASERIVDRTIRDDPEVLDGDEVEQDALGEVEVRDGEPLDVTDPRP